MICAVGQKLDGPGWYVFARKGFLSEYRKTRQVASIDLRTTRDCLARITTKTPARPMENACALACPRGVERGQILALSIAAICA